MLEEQRKPAGSEHACPKCGAGMVPTSVTAPSTTKNIPGRLTLDLHFLCPRCRTRTTVVKG